MSFSISLDDLFERKADMTCFLFFSFVGFLDTFRIVRASASVWWSGAIAIVFFFYLRLTEGVMSWEEEATKMTDAP